MDNAVTADLVLAARKGRRDAVVELLAIYYPVVWRIASGLTGRADVGRGVTKYIMQRSLRVLHAWRDEGAPTRWFHHHTLLTARRTQKHQPDIANDTLITERARQQLPAYVAFVRAFRGLPVQQREAFLLTHGEKFDIRALAVAMDCSTTAAGTHLREATDRLHQLGPSEFDGHLARMVAVYRTLGPDEAMSITDIRRQVRRFVLPWIAKRLVSFCVAVLVLAAVLWGAWWVWRIVDHSMST